MATEKKAAKSTGKKSASKKAEERNIEEEKKKFHEKLIALKELAKSKKNVLELGEINNFLADIQLDEEKTEKVIDLLEASGVDVLRIGFSFYRTRRIYRPSIKEKLLSKCCFTCIRMRNYRKSSSFLNF